MRGYACGARAASQLLRPCAQAKMLVAEVLSVEPHPSADRLRVVTVDTGSRTVKVGTRAYEHPGRAAPALPRACMGIVSSPWWR